MKLPRSKLLWIAFGFGITVAAAMYPAESGKEQPQSQHEIIFEFEPGEAPSEDIYEMLPVPETLPSISLKAAAEQKSKVRTALDTLSVSVYLTKEKRTERVPLELYVRGVIAGEMPVQFELEALKAQAIAARTYVYKQLSDPGAKPAAKLGGDITDSVQHQVYIPLEQLLSRWTDEERKSYLSLLNRAVEETRGQIITYEGEPVEAFFFSTSNGFTENSEDYWGKAFPYLRSVKSPWDVELSPRYKETMTFKLKDFYKKLGVKKGSENSMRVLKRTDGRRVKEITIGGKIFSGREVRERLGLQSSHFTWKVHGKEISITTYGYGHGVGMSQWGANGMAKSGKTAEQIIQHYYTGAKVEQAEKLPKRL